MSEVKHTKFELKPEAIKDIIEKLVPGTRNNISKGICPTCKSKTDPREFRDKLSIEENSISGMCQLCQDKVFGK